MYDLGAFGQTLMLGAAARKIDSIPAWKSVKYPSVVKNIMQIPDDKQLIMGIALGYRNQATKINVFYTERSEVDKFLSYPNTVRPNRIMLLRSKLYYSPIQSTNTLFYAFE
ncbi:nitroreductase family protein [Ligilactobacillus faecis]|nr:nitroreductase family protein [Ligilactobacillus faecis]WGN90537.1 nitroreductase family protein [Ligilactobacillus faecis]